MTRISYSDPHGEDAECDLHIEGHSNPECCAALSALWCAFISGIERLAGMHPDDLKLYQPAE